MFKAITKGMKKLIPGQSNTQDHRQTQSLKQGSSSQTRAANKAGQPTLPDSYWDAGLFK